MLQLIRDRAQGIIVWTIVGLIIITFALFGLSSYLSGVSKVNVATVNGVEISETELVRAYQNYQQRLQQMLGKNYNPDMFNEAVLKREVLQSLISRELVNQYLFDTGFGASPQQVLDFLHAIPAFQEEGKFSAQRYEQVLAVQGMSKALFEQDVARDLMAEQLRNSILQSDFVTASEHNSYSMLQNQERDIGYVQFSRQSYLQEIKLDDAEIEAYYNERRSEFMTAEQVSINYVELDLNKAANQFDVSDDEIKSYYQQNLANYVKQPEQRKASHILFKVDDSADETKAKQQAIEVLAQIKNGASFAEMAKQYSQDIGSAKQGGDLGYFGKGVMDAAFEATTFKLSKGEVSEPVRSSFGYHLIKVEDIRAETVTPLKEVSATIKKDLQLQQAEKTFYEDTTRLENLSYENPDSLELVASELGLKEISSGLFGRRGGAGLLSNPKVLSAVFSDEVLNQGRNSELIELSDTHVLVLRVNEHKPATQQPLAQVQARITTLLKQVNAAKLASEQAAQAREKLLAGEDAKKLAKSYKIKWQAPGFIKRTPGKDDKLSPQIRQEVFKLAKPNEARPVVSVVGLNNGDTAVVALYAVREGSVETEPAKQKADNVRLAAMQGNVSYAAMMESLQTQADITVVQKTAQE